MSVQSKTDPSPAVSVGTLLRVLEEAHGPRDAWYGTNLPAALADVDAALAYRRPAPGRHNIAELALHHAYWLREVRGRLTGASPEPFVLKGEDWFDLDDGSRVDWAGVRREVEKQAAKLTEAVEATASGRVSSPLDEGARVDLVVGIAGHAAYHAGQVQLVRKLLGA